MSNGTPSTAPETNNDLRMGPKRRGWLLLLLGALTAIGPLTSDMYLPAFPAMAEELQASPSGIQFTLTGALIGMSVGQLFVGPLSDAIGRRKPLLVGVLLHIVASLAIFFVQDIVTLDILRVLQGFGSATATVITMAIVRDMFHGRMAATALSRLMLVLGVSPILAPTLGGIILTWTNWRGIFIALAVLSVIIGIVTAIYLPETLPAGKRRKGGVGGALRDYGFLLRDGKFVGLILVAGLAMVTIFAFVAGSPFAFQGHFGMSEQVFGYVFGAGAIFVTIGAQVNASLLRRKTPLQLMVPALFAVAIFSVILVIVSVTGAGGIVGVLIPLWGALLAVGFVTPNAPALALSRHGQIAGTAAALLGAFQFGIGAVAAPVVGVIGTGPEAMAIVMAVAVALAIVILYAFVRPRQLAVELGKVQH